MKGVANFAGMVGREDSLRKGRKFKRFSPEDIVLERSRFE
jgi:hypothetical protein